jgi:hypothetical protein
VIETAMPFGANPQNIDNAAQALYEQLCLFHIFSATSCYCGSATVSFAGPKIKMSTLHVV